MFNQVFGTATGTKCALPYVCHTIEYKEETKLITPELPKYFSIQECEFSKDTLMMVLFFGPNT